MFSVHNKGRHARLILGAGCGIATLLSATFAPQASALPSFARQTGQDCAACHVGSFGPQLTPYGKKFKIGGYTETGGDKKPDFNVPVSAMLVASHTKVDKDPAEAATKFVDRNENNVIQEASLFLAGGFGEHFGALVQGTYSGLEHKSAIDQMDLRFATTTQLVEADTTLGVSINNNPTVQDPWNSTPVWGYPYTSADDLGMGTGTTPLLAGAMEQKVVGVTGYLYWNDSIYAEVGGYRNQSTDLLRTTNVVGRDETPDKLDGFAPYWRLAYNLDFDRQNVTVGLIGMNADVKPEGTSEFTNKYRDIGVDATYQYLGTRKHMFAVNSSYIHEHFNVNDGEAEHGSGTLNSFTLNGSYYYDRSYGFTAGYFNNNGSSDEGLYGPLTDFGSRKSDPDTAGYILQADWTPFGKEDSWGAPLANLRVGVQYTLYDTYNGASSNYDGAGRDAKDNDTLMLFLWTSI